MSPGWYRLHGGRHEHPSGIAHGRCLYEAVLRQAIATQHGQTDADRLELRACLDCGKPYLLARVWQPLADEGEIACPRCGAQAVAWAGARGYIAYWHREGALPERHAGETVRSRS